MSLASRRLLLAGAGGLLCQPAAGWLGALAGCDERTTGRRITVETRASGSAVRGEAFETSLGFVVRLEVALLGLGPIAYLEGAPVARRRGILAAAWAHPGHYAEGLQLGEMTEPQVVDLLGPEASLGIGAGVTGRAQSAKLTFYEAAGEAGLSMAVARIEGSAESASGSVAFWAQAAIDELLASASGRPEIAGCPLVDGDFAGDGVVRLTVDLGLWLDAVDFALVPPSPQPVELIAGEPPRAAWIRGMRKAAAYRFAWEVA